jgi:hypothetical protein
MNISLYLKRDSMKTFDNIFYEQDGYEVISFINSSEESEYTIYTLIDGGFIELKN